MRIRDVSGKFSTRYARQLIFPDGIMSKDGRDVIFTGLRFQCSPRIEIPAMPTAEPQLLGWTPTFRSLLLCVVLTVMIPEEGHTEGAMVGLLLNTTGGGTNIVEMEAAYQGDTANTFGFGTILDEEPVTYQARNYNAQASNDLWTSFSGAVTLVYAVLPSA